MKRKEVLAIIIMMLISVCSFVLPIFLAVAIDPSPYIYPLIVTAMINFVIGGFAVFKGIWALSDNITPGFIKSLFNE